jgi:hypothetical protein
MLLLILSGFIDLLICKIIKWVIEINLIKNAKIKWIEKNRFIKILLINKLPQINIINLLPIIGIVEIKLVITILAQYAICLQINAYPKKDTIIKKIKIIIPVFHIFLFI